MRKDESAPVLEVRDLQTHFRVGEQTKKVLDGLSITVREAETMGVVGASGSGKSVLARSIMGLLPEPGYVHAGEIRFRGTNLVTMSPNALNELRGKGIALIVSNPRSRLNPLLDVGKQLANVIAANQGLDKAASRTRAVELLDSVAIGDPKRVFHMLPSELSGGMCQRVIIAMALSSSPRLIIADEPTAGLDVTVQRQVLELISDLVHRTGTALLLMTRDLGIIAHYCQQVAVLKDGHIVENRPVRAFFSDPQHEHSKMLLNATFAAKGEN